MVRRQLIEWDDDVGAERFLRLNRGLRSEQYRTAIPIRAEKDSLFADFHHVAALLFSAPALQFIRNRTIGQRKNLKAPGVGDDRHLPSHEFMESASPSHHIRSGLEQKMVRVAEHELKPNRIDHLVVESL